MTPDAVVVRRNVAYRSAYVVGLLASARRFVAATVLIDVHAQYDNVDVPGGALKGEAGLLVGSLSSLAGRVHLANFHALRSWRAQRSVDDSDPLPWPACAPVPLSSSGPTRSSVGESISSPPKPALSLSHGPPAAHLALALAPNIVWADEHEHAPALAPRVPQRIWQVPNLVKPVSGSSLSQNTPPRKLGRSRPASDTDSRPQPSPSAFNTRRVSDDGWVSVFIMPVLSERSPAGTSSDDRVRGPASASSVAPGGKRLSSAGDITLYWFEIPPSIAPARVSYLAGAVSTPQPQDTGWKLESRGAVCLVRWVSRRDKDKRTAVVQDANKNERPDQHPSDKKFIVEESDWPLLRKGFSIPNEARRSRDSYTQPVPRPNAPSDGLGPVRVRPLSIVRPRSKLEAESEGDAKRRSVTKLNPGLAISRYGRRVMKGLVVPWASHNKRERALSWNGYCCRARYFAQRRRGIHSRYAA
ncbi:hypothetical protein FRC09_001178 [Ceratobasidium sp. 395]|nr:hypothetical protein FRC09_001178 [Ceratobasidium sp. 395]